MSICREIISRFVIIALLYIVLFCNVCHTIVNKLAPSYSRLRLYHS